MTDFRDLLRELARVALCLAGFGFWLAGIVSYVLIAWVVFT